VTRVLITGARAPVALHLARLLKSAGCEIVLADTLAAPLAASSQAVSDYIQLPPPDTQSAAFLSALRQALSHHRPELVIPTCEEVFYLAWAFETGAFQIDAVTPTLFAPSFALLARAHNKAIFAEDALAFGLAPPATQLITGKAALDRLTPQSRSLVFKPVWSRFADRVLICPDPGQLAALAPTRDAPWIAQEFISGEEICCYSVASSGKLLSLAAYRPTHRAGKGAGIYFTPVDDEPLAADCAAYIRQTRWTGQISFDFRRDQHGRLRVLECNPRATSGVHFFGPGSRLSGTFLSGRPSQPSIDGPLMIPAAMWLYGLPASIGRWQIQAWWRDLTAARDALAWPGDRLPTLAQPRALAELAGLALRERKSLIAASTEGIAWNGAPIGATQPNRR
jgi:predicted ATP-grasp superfamily ATP-dependent carboligase